MNEFVILTSTALVGIEDVNFNPFIHREIFSLRRSKFTFYLVAHPSFNTKDVDKKLVKINNCRKMAVAGSKLKPKQAIKTLI